MQTLSIPEAPSRATAQPARERWRALDLFRAVAVLSMIQGHTFTALLRASEYRGNWASWHSVFHGLTAPMFLMGGGIAYGMTVFGAQRSRAGGFDRRVLRRVFVLLAIGYSLQIPKAALATIAARRDLQEYLFRIGPLQLIAACLLGCECLRVLLGNRRAFRRSLLVIALAVAGSAPWVWQARPSVRWVALGMWLDGQAGSLFPLFPWAVFFLGGVLIALAIGGPVRAAARARLSSWMIAVGVASAAAAYLTFVNGQQLRGLYGEHAFWHTNPLYVAFRGGVVLAWLGLLSALEPRLMAALSRWGWFEHALGVLSKRSLLAYVAHLIALYGSPWTAGLIKLGATLTLPEAGAIAFGLILSTTLATMAWHAVAALDLARLVPFASAPGSAFEVNGVGEREWLDGAAPERRVETGPH